MKTIVRIFALVALVMVIAPAGGAPDGASRTADAPRVPAPTLDAQIAMLQKQVQALQEQVALLQSALQVTATGTTLRGPAVSIISSGGMLLRSDRETTVMVGSDMTVRTGSGLSIRAGSTGQIESSAGLSLKGATAQIEGIGGLTVKGATALVEGSGGLMLKGAVVRLNAGTRPLATVGSVVGNGLIVTGSPTVLAE